MIYPISRSIFVQLSPGLANGTCAAKLLRGQEAKYEMDRFGWQVIERQGWLGAGLGYEGAFPAVHFQRQVCGPSAA